jgi:hypothetical protein
MADQMTIRNESREVVCWMDRPRFVEALVPTVVEPQDTLLVTP